MANKPAKGRKTTVSSDEPGASAAQTDTISNPIPAELHKSAAEPDKPALDESTAQISNLTADTAATDGLSPADPVTQPPAKGSGWSGLIALIVGGIIAGAIGFAVANISNPVQESGLQDQIAAQAARITVLEQALIAQAPVDLDPLLAEQADLARQVTNLSDRITTLEQQPMPAASGTPVDDTTLTDDISALRDQIAQMTAAAQTELDTARRQAAAIEQNAAAAARDAAARAALARVQTALESGAPIGAALTDLQDALQDPVPEALTDVRDGVPTLAMLQDSFPDAARLALAAARRDGAAGEQTTGLGAFFRNQFDVRSTAPQTGASTDAILSRAEDAVRRGRLSDALAELGALPDVARTDMADWLTLAEQRADAMAAVDMLTTTLSRN